MRLDEVENYYQNLSDEDLRQKINEDNTTDVSSDDLVKVVRTHQLNEWHEINVDEHLNQIQEMINNIVAEENQKKKF